MQAINVKLTARRDKVLSLRYPGGHEVVSGVEEIQHPVVRQALQKCGINTGFDLLLNSDPAHFEDFAATLSRSLS